MTDQEAIEKIKMIQSGESNSRMDFPEKLKGNIAKRVWDDSDFSYGFEYGEIYGLMQAFDIEVIKDLGYKI